MARAEMASASLRSDSIQGLAKSIAKPAYRRLLSAEPLLRRAVPALIIAFLLTICVGAVVQVLEQRRQVARDARQVIEALADQITLALEHTGHDLRGNPNRNSAALERIMPAWAPTADRTVLVADADGAIVASYPNDPQKLGRPILDLRGAEQVENGPAELLRIVRVARNDRAVGVGDEHRAVGRRRPRGHDAFQCRGIAVWISAQIVAGMFKRERYLIGQGFDRLPRVTHDLPTLLEHLHHRADADRQQKGDDERRHGAPQKRLCAEEAAVGRLGDRLRQTLDRIRT